VEASGDTAALRAAIDLAADGGTVAISSWYARHAALPPLGARFHQGAVTLVAIDEAAPSPAPRWPRERRMALIRDLLPRLRLRDLISHRLRFAEGPAAYDLIDRFPGETVVVALSYAEEHWQAETDADDGDGDGQAGGLSQIASEPHGNG
jgi:threonine dehydrogenase-like Zn-dependent dehydrogenase